jgi:hypothetical protein
MRTGDNVFKQWASDGTVAKLGIDIRNDSEVAKAKEFARYTAYSQMGMAKDYLATVRMDGISVSDQEIVDAHIERKKAENLTLTSFELKRNQTYDKIANTRLDAFGGIGSALQRDLEALDPKTYAIEYQDQSIWRNFVPVRTDIRRPGVTTYRYKMSDFTAKGKESSEGVSDIPMVNANMASFEQPITKYTTGYQITDDEVKAFLEFGETPDPMYLNAVDESYTRFHYNAVLNGLENGTEGLLNNSNFANAVVATSGAAVTWAAKKALGTQVGLDAIMFDVQDVVTDLRIASQDRYWNDANPGDIKVPIAQYMLLATTARSLAAGSDMTLLSYILMNTPGLRSIQPMLDLEGAGTGSTDLMLAYMPEARMMEYIITQERMWLPVQMQGELWKYGSNEKVAGLVVRNSVPHAYRYGI